MIIEHCDRLTEDDSREKFSPKMRGLEREIYVGGG